MRSALAKIAGQELPGSGLPFRSITFGHGERTARFQLQGHHYVLNRESYEVREETASEADRLEPRLLSKAAIVGPPRVYEIRSPDGRWHLGAADDNLYLRSVIDGHMEGLTNDASKDFGWAFEWNTLPVWSPDTHLIAVKRTGRLSHQQANGDSAARSAPRTATTPIRSLIICCHLERDHKSLKPTRRQALSLTAYNACLVDQFTIRQLTISEVARHAEKASTWA